MISKAPHTTAVIVNYHSAEFTLQAVRSILDSQSLGPIDVYVVENSGDKSERSLLQDRLPKEATLRINDANVGFGAACNQIFYETESDFFLLLNPDAMLVGYSLQRLQHGLLENEQVGAITPQAFWDEDLQFFIPPAQSPGLFMLQPELGRLGEGNFIYYGIQKAWRRYTLRAWQAKDSIMVGNICGGHVLLKRTAVQESGGLFDPRFFLYFEDTDLFIRMRKAGYELLLEPQARVIHHYDQCDPSNRGNKKLLMVQSHEQFVQKHAMKRHDLAKRILRSCGHMKVRQDMCPASVINDPSQISVPEALQKNWLFEWSPNPDFIPSVGYFGQGSWFFFPRKGQEKLGPGRYFMRISRPFVLNCQAKNYCWIKQGES